MSAPEEESEFGDLLPDFDILTDQAWFRQSVDSVAHLQSGMQEGRKVPWCRTHPFLADAQTSGEGCSSFNSLAEICKRCLAKVPATARAALIAHYT